MELRKNRLKAFSFLATTHKVDRLLSNFFIIIFPIGPKILYVILLTVDPKTKSALVFPLLNIDAAWPKSS